MKKGFSTREVAKLCDLTQHRVRALVQAGVVVGRINGEGRAHRSAHGKARRLRFAFRDVQVLRCVGRLLEQGLPWPRVKRTLCSLQRLFTRLNLPLSSAMCFTEAGQVFASDGYRLWDVESGSLLASPQERPTAALLRLPTQVGSFTQAAKAPPVAGLGLRWPRHALERGLGAFGEADVWFDRALKAQQQAPRKACSFYLQAIACNPEHVEAMINLGNLCAAERDSQRAAAFFRLATRVDPHHSIAHFNLAVVLHDGGECGAAMQAYRKALMLDPNFADAHYNLGTLLAQMGHNTEAGTHFTAFHAAIASVPPHSGGAK